MVVDLVGREYRIDLSVLFRFLIEFKKNEVFWVKLEKDVFKSFLRKIIEGVLIWIFIDIGNVNIGYFNNVGFVLDLWGDWDGCFLIVVLMVVVYYDF